MSIVSIFFSILAAVEHIYIFYLETIITDSKKTSEVFGIEEESLKEKTVSTLFKNQGVYNLLLSIILIISIAKNDLFWIRILLSYIILVALYGGYSSNIKIIWKQGGLAMLGLFFSLF